MNNRITERELRQIIENNVRRFLFEENEDDDIMIQLKDPGFNQAEVARYLIKTIWKGMDEDTARSLLSKKIRGVISIKPEEKHTIKMAVHDIIKIQ